MNGMGSSTSSHVASDLLQECCLLCCWSLECIVEDDLSVTKCLYLCVASLLPVCVCGISRDTCWLQVRHVLVCGLQLVRDVLLLCVHVCNLLCQPLLLGCLHLTLFGPSCQLDGMLLHGVV